MTIPEPSSSPGDGPSIGESAPAAIHEGGGLTVDVLVAEERWSTSLDEPVALVEQAAMAAWRAGGAPGPDAEASIVLAGDSTVADLNQRYRGKAGPTNVLSFGMLNGAEAAPADATAMLGDVVLAYDTVAREAGEAGKPLADHARHLVVHGMLHLLGYDHETDADARVMEALETRTLAGLGVPDPYGEPVPSADGGGASP